MFKPKKIGFSALALIISLLLVATLCPIIDVKAQSQATIVVLDAVGGTATPSGTTTYADGAIVTLTASPGTAFSFAYWLISDGTSSNIVSDNPTTLTVSGGLTYAIQPIFAPFQPVPGANMPANLATAAIVVVLGAAGGTTTPPTGTYALADASFLTLTAIPSSDWQFSHWVISGQPQSHGAFPYTPTPTDNPYKVDHGYGYTYYYQPVFTPVGSTEPTPIPSATATPTGIMGGLTTETWIIIGLIVVIILILIAFGIFATRKRK